MVAAVRARLRKGAVMRTLKSNGTPRTVTLPIPGMAVMSPISTGRPELRPLNSIVEITSPFKSPSSLSSRLS